MEFRLDCTNFERSYNIVNEIQEDVLREKLVTRSTKQQHYQIWFIEFGLKAEFTDI